MSGGNWKGYLVYEAIVVISLDYNSSSCSESNYKNSKTNLHIVSIIDFNTFGFFALNDDYIFVFSCEDMRSFSPENIWPYRVLGTFYGREAIPSLIVCLFPFALSASCTLEYSECSFILHQVSLCSALASSIESRPWINIKPREILDRVLLGVSTNYSS